MARIDRVKEELTLHRQLLIVTVAVVVTVVGWIAINFDQHRILIVVALATALGTMVLAGYLTQYVYQLLTIARPLHRQPRHDQATKLKRLAQ
jgi:uncharacterized membrane protein